MRTVTIRQAKAQFSKFIDDVLLGEEIIIVKAGQPIAKLIPFENPMVRRFGILKGKIKIAKDFDLPLTNFFD